MLSNQDNPGGSMDSKDVGAMMKDAERVIGFVATKWAGNAGGDVDFDDLMQIGREAALLSLRSWSPEGGASFATYVKRPVETAIRNATRKKNPRISLDAPLLSSYEGDSLGALIPDESSVPADESARGRERDAEVRAIVRRVVREFTAHQDMAALIVERLTAGSIVEEQFRSEVKLSEIAEVSGCSKQYVGVVEKQVKARLAVELRKVARDF